MAGVTVAEIALFYALGGAQRGPISHSELLAGIVEGRIPPTALIWRQGFDTWMAIPGRYRATEAKSLR